MYTYNGRTARVGRDNGKSLGFYGVAGVGLGATVTGPDGLPITIPDTPDITGAGGDTIPTNSSLPMSDITSFNPVTQNLPTAGGGSITVTTQPGGGYTASYTAPVVPALGSGATSNTTILIGLAVAAVFVIAIAKK